MRDDGRGELFVVGISWRTAPVAVREKLAFREEELAGTLQKITAQLPVAEALLISTCNRVEVYGVSKPGAEPTSAVRAFITEQRQVKPKDIGDALYAHSGPVAVRHVFRVASALDSLVVGEAQILGQLKAAYGLANKTGTSGPVLSRALERAFGVAKRVRTETTIARGAANVSSVAVELASRVFGNLAGKSVLVVGAGKMSSLAAKHLYANGAQRIVVTNRSPQKADALAEEVEGIAKPWEQLEQLLVESDVVISSTGAREPVLTKKLFKSVMKQRRYRQMMVIDIAVPRDAEPSIVDIDGCYLFDIDDLDKVVQANLAERQKAAEHATKIVEHEANQFEHWLRMRTVVPTIKTMHEKFAQVADLEVQKALEQVARKDLTRDQQRELVQRTVERVVAKLLHQPSTVLRGADPQEAQELAAAVCELFALEPSESTDAVADSPVAEQSPEQKKAQA